jgi:hypothetical protein
MALFIVSSRREATTIMKCRTTIAGENVECPTFIGLDDCRDSIREWERPSHAREEENQNLVRPKKHKASPR